MIGTPVFKHEEDNYDHDDDIAPVNFSKKVGLHSKIPSTVFRSKFANKGFLPKRDLMNSRKSNNSESSTLMSRMTTRETSNRD